MNEIWGKVATDEEIANCNGDYFGCEVCRNQGRCAELTLLSLEESLRSSQGRKEKSN